MAYDYQKTKKLYEQLNDQQKAQFANDKSGNVQQFLSDYQKETGNVYTPQTTQQQTKVTNTYQNQGTGNYTYNPTTGYYENQSTSYQNQGAGNYVYNPTTGYYENTSKVNDKINTPTNSSNTPTTSSSFYGQGNTTGNTGNANADYMNQAYDIYNKSQKGYSDLMGGGSNYAQTFDEAVSNKLKSAYGINSLAEFKQKYPEYYDSLVGALDNIQGVRDATDPNQRQMLDGQLQGIIGSMVGAGSDTSKIKVLEESVLNKFENPDQVKSDMQNIVKLQTEGKSTSEIASEMGISEDQVQQAILAYNGLDNKLGEYYKLTDKASKDITEPYDTKLQRLEEEKKIALERANRNVDYLKQDFDTAMERQKQANEINAHNADAISGQYGYGFSKRGIEGLNYVDQQAQQIIDDLTKNYDRNKQEMADGIADIIRNWQYNNEDLNKAMQDALTNAKNNYTSNMLAIQQQYGTVGMQAQQYLAQNVQAFIEQAENIYDNGLKRQQENLSNLITNVSNLNALAYQDITLRNAKIQQFQQEALTKNRTQLQELANQLGMTPQEYGDLIEYQVQAVQNQLNGYVPGSGVQFQDEISTMLEGGANAQEVIQRVMNQPAFKSMQTTSSTWHNAGNGWLYDDQGNYKRIEGFDGTSTTSSTSPAGTTMGTYGATNSYVSSQTVNGKTYGVSENTIYGLENFMNEHQVGSTGGQCGKFVNDYLESIGVGRIFTDPIDKKKAAINTEEGYKPQVGDIAVMNSPTSPQYGHVAIVIGVDGDKITTLESNKSGEGEVFTRTFTPNQRYTSKVFGYYHPDGETTNVAASGTAGGTAMGEQMSDYDINTATMRIGRMAYGANISNSESERVEKVLRDGASMGKTQTDILYDVLGMTITNNKDKAEPLINIMLENADEDGLKGYDTVGFANLINSGKIDLAVNKVEKAVANKQGIGKDFVDNEASSIAMYDKGDRAIKLINDNLNKLGIVAGNWNKQKSKFLKNENFQQLESALTALVADWRHEMAGSAVTETELKMIDSLIPSVKDNPYNAIQKIQELQNDVLARYNSQRGTLDLPYVDQNTLKDKKQRANLYYQNQGNNNISSINNPSAISYLANQIQNTGRISAGGTMRAGSRF